MECQLSCAWTCGILGASQVVLVVKIPPANAGDVRDQEDLEQGVTTHCSILAWKIPWKEEPGGLLGVAESDMTEHTHTHTHTHTHGILAPQPGIRPTFPTLEGRIFTTGPLGKSHLLSFLCKHEKVQSWGSNPGHPRKSEV